MSPSREIKQLQKTKTRAQSGNNLKEEANLCNQLGELLARNGDYKAAIEEHRQELALSEVLQDVIGSAVANRKIGECFAELGNFEDALKYQNRHLDLARSVKDAAEEQRALATIGRTFLYCFESDQSQDSLRRAEDAFKRSLAIVDKRLEGTVSARELSEMRARLFLNLGFVYDSLKEPQRCSEFMRRSIFIAEKNQLVEDMFRANFNLGSIHFRQEQPSRAVRCLEQAKECARKMKDKFAESECFSSISKVLLSLGDFVAARRSLKKAYTLGSQQPAERQAVKKMLRQAIQGCRLEEAMSELGPGHLQEALGLWEQLGDLYCKVGCFAKAVEAYMSQLSCAVSLGKPARELAVIHVSLATTYADLHKYDKAIEHYHQELKLREGSPNKECETWLSIALCVEDGGRTPEEVDRCYGSALRCAETAGSSTLQCRVLKAWLKAQQRSGSSQCAETEARLQELCVTLGGDVGESEEEEQDESSELQDDSVIELSQSEDEDLEEYNKLVPGSRRTARWNKRNEKGETSLHRACIEGNLKQVQYLVDQGHPTNPRDYCGWTPLHEACNHGHLEIVSLLLDRGANVNDPGGPLCEGVTPLHDALCCGHFQVARLLVEKGASVGLRNAKGQTPLDCLKLWWKEYRQELDQETQRECVQMEKLLKKAATRTAFPTPVVTKPTDPLQDSQLFDAENSEPLVSSGGGCSSPPGQSSHPMRSREPAAIPGNTTWRRSAGRGCRQRGTEQAVLFGDSSSSDHSDSDCSISPLRPVRPRSQFPASSSSLATSPSQDTHVTADRPDASAPLSGSEDYQRTIRNLGSAQNRLLSPSLSDPCFSSTPAGPISGRSALVREEEYLEDDWLEDDVGETQPKKRRRVGLEQQDRGREAKMGSTPRSEHHCGIGTSSDPSVGVSHFSSRRQTQKTRQPKMTQLPGMVNLGRREVGQAQSPSLEEQNREMASVAPGPSVSAQAATPMPAPIRMRVKVQDNVFLIPVPHSEMDTCTVSWLCEQAAQRYYQACGLLPRLSLEKEGALLFPNDPLLSVLQSNEEVLAEVTSWNLPPLSERYRKACQSLSVDENRFVSRLCEAQDRSPSVSVCGLSLPPAALTPVLRALKLQATLTELRLSGNRLHDDLMPELVAAAATMPKLRLLDLSANCITEEGLRKAGAVLDGQTQTTFPCLETLDLSVNPLGDGVTQPLACLLSACPLLSTLSLQACGLTARFLQQHRLLLASMLTGLENFRSVCLSHNALGSTGIELVLKTLPLNSLTHLHLSAVRSGPSDFPGTDHFCAHLSQDCAVTYLSLAGNGLTDSDLVCLSRCLPLCPSLTSLDLSGNPSVTVAGLNVLLESLKRAQRPLVFLNLQGCSVGGPWKNVDMASISAHIQELRLCSKHLGKLERQTLLQSWEGQSACILSRNSKCFVRASPRP